MEGGIQGLIVVFSACMIQVLAFGNYACIGTYTVYLLQEFDQDTVAVSLISSIHFALLLGCGPFISFLMTKFSYRKLSVIGALLVFVGLLCFPMFMYLPAMYLFFGVFAGLGGCFIYLPSHVLSGMYYDKYRALSTGVATTGTGLGGTIMPIIVPSLIEKYTWKGSLLILAGIELNLLVFALLMIPPPIPPVVKENDSDDEYRLSELQSRSKLSDHKTPRTKDFDLSPCKAQSEKFFPSELKRGNSHKNLLCLQEAQKNSAESNHINSNHNLSHKNNNEENHIKRRLKTCHSIPDDDISVVLQPSYLAWATNLSVRGSKLYENFPSIITETDILDNSDHSHAAYNYKLSPSAQKKSETFMHKTLKEVLKYHLLLFVNVNFVIYFFSTIMWSLSTIIFITFNAEFFITKGLSEYDAAFVNTYAGVGQLVGCVITSVSGTYIGKRTATYMLSNILTGVFYCIAPLYNSYLWIVMICLGSGLAYGGILGLYMIVLVDIVGIDFMEVGLGYLMLASGIGCFAGPPLAGYVKEISGDYNNSFYMAGIFAVIGGVSMLLTYVRCFKNKEPKEVMV